MACCQSAKDFCQQCMRWCKNQDEERYRICIENKESPMIISRSVSFRTTYLAENSNSEIHSEKSPTNVYNAFSSKTQSYSTNLVPGNNTHLKPVTNLKGESSYQQLVNEMEPTKEISINMPIQITHEKLFNNLSLKVLPYRNVSDRFDVHLKGPKNFKPKKLLFYEKKIFEGISENDLKHTSLYFKFYDRRIPSETRRIGEGRFRLRTLFEIGVQDNIRHMMTELTLSHQFSTDSPGSIELSMRYDLMEKQLIVTFLNGKDFLEDLGNRLNVYCTIDLMKNEKKVNSFKTSIQYDTLNPKWNETFSFPASQKDLNLNIKLKIKAYNDCDSEKLILGQLVFPSSTESSETKHWKSILWHSNEPVVTWHSFLPIV